MVGVKGGLMKQAGGWKDGDRLCGRKVEAVAYVIGGEGEEAQGVSGKNVQALKL